MTSGRAPTERRSDSSDSVIWKSTPRRSICCTSSCVVRPLILTASISPLLVIGFLAVCAPAAAQMTSAAQRAASAARKTLLLFETACVDMTSTSLINCGLRNSDCGLTGAALFLIRNPNSAIRLALYPAVALDEVDDELRLFGLLRQRGEVVVLVVAAALHLDVERTAVARAADQNAEAAAHELVDLDLVDFGVVGLEGVLPVVGLEGDVRTRDEERARTIVAETPVGVVVEDAEGGGAAEINRPAHVLLGLGEVVLKVELREAEELVCARLVRLHLNRLSEKLRGARGVTRVVGRSGLVGQLVVVGPAPRGLRGRDRRLRAARARRDVVGRYRADERVRPARALDLLRYLRVRLKVDSARVNELLDARGRRACL